MRLLDLYRRRHLAYELLDDYDRDHEQIDMEAARAAILRFVETFRSGLQAQGTTAWSEAARKRAKDWPR